MMKKSEKLEVKSEKEDQVSSFSLPNSKFLIPPLRFPEFRGAEEWKLKKLSTSVQLVSGMHLSPEQYGKEGAVPYFTGPSDFTNDPKEITKRTGDSTSLAQANDTLITVKGSGVGEIWFLTLPSVAIGRQLMAVRSVDAASRFISHFLLTKRSRFEGLAAGNLIPGLSRGDILDIEAPFPPLAEQQKIAECLSSVDVLMAAQARKVDALKTYKKGLMQQLFPREGETQPRLRFPEFQKTGAWKLGKIGTMLVETQRPIELSDAAEYRLITVKRRYGGLVSRGVLKGREILVKSQFVVRAGDFLISKRQIVHNACGLVTQELDGSVVSNEYSVLTPKPECSIEFFSWFAMQPAVSTSFMNCSVGIVIEKMLFKLPSWLKQEFLFPSLAEQQRIATCLSSLDALITAETQKLDALKTHKKGLMQQLFPSPEEML